MIRYNKAVLENGLTVLHEERDVPVTTVMMAVRFGALYESEEEKGIAHFMEHLCFKGTDKRTTEEISSALEKVGGELNAFTSEEMTAYHVRLPSRHLELGIDVISDIFFNPIFPDDEIEKEGNVIVEEIKMYRDNPRAHVLEGIKANLFVKPYGMFIAGTPETVKSLTREQILAKHRLMYIPKNSVLCVVGNNSFDEVLAFAKRYALVTRDGTLLKDDLNVQPQLLSSEEHRSELAQSNLALGCHFPIESSKDRYVAEVFSTILGGGMSSKLFLEVREKRGLVYSVKSDVDLGRNYGLFFIWAGTDASKVSKVINIARKEFSKMASITQQELDETKVQLIGIHEVEREASSDTAIHLIRSEFEGDAQDYYSFAEKINSVTLDDIKKLASISDFAQFVLGP